jgi:hypothetical protein
MESLFLEELIIHGFAGGSAMPRLEGVLQQRPSARSVRASPSAQILLSSSLTSRRTKRSRRCSAWHPALETKKTIEFTNTRLTWSCKTNAKTPCPTITIPVAMRAFAFRVNCEMQGSGKAQEKAKPTPSGRRGMPRRRLSGEASHSSERRGPAQGP